MARKPAPKKAKKAAKGDEPAAQPNKGGRPSIYTEELGRAVCVHIANGLSLRSIEKIDGMPGKTTILEWALDDRNGFRTLYARARELQLEAEADEIVDISDDSTNDFVEREARNGDIKIVLDREHIDRAKLRVETRKWRLTKLAPHKYGDKVEQTIKADEAFLGLWKSMNGDKP